MTGRSHEAREQDDLHTAKEIKENVDVMKVRRTSMDACHGKSHRARARQKGLEGSRRFGRILLGGGSEVTLRGDSDKLKQTPDQSITEGGSFEDHSGVTQVTQVCYASRPFQLEGNTKCNSRNKREVQQW